MRLLKAEDRTPVAWKNGGGETVEVAVHPPGAGLSGFDWRVSVATVTEDGPFSTFSGVDRTIAILDGEGLDLLVRGRAPQRLTPSSAPRAFPGDVETTARLVAGPVTDLNVMTRRDAVRQRVRRLRACDPPVRASGRWVILVAPDGASVIVGGRRVILGALDALSLEGGATIEPCDGDGPAGFLLVEIDAASSRA